MKGIFACTALALVVVLASGKDTHNHTKPEIPEELPVLDCPNCPIGNQTCDCSVDIVIILDRSGSIDSDSFDNVRELIKDFIKSLDYECSRTSVISYDNIPPKVEYGFHDPEATDPNLACDKVDNIAYPSGGGTQTGSAILEACSQLIFISTPTGVCKVVALFTDGQSTFPASTLLAAEQLNTKTDARVCGMGMEDPGESQSAKDDRFKELNGISERSYQSSSALFDTDYSPADFVGSDEYDQAFAILQECVCRPCYTQQPNSVQP